MSDFRLSAIPYPRADVESLRTTTLALKEAVENLGGMRADDIGRSARYTELQTALSAIGLLRTSDVLQVVGPAVSVDNEPAVWSGVTGKLLKDITYTVFKTNLGLGNVNNTSDVAKPVSTAQQTALDLKANIASPVFTGSPQLDLNNSGATAITRLMDGFELGASGMNTTSKYTRPIKFISSDSAFTTENPKLLAYIVGVAIETYNLDTGGAMNIEFGVSPPSPGVTNIPVAAFKIASTGPYDIINLPGTALGVGINANTTAVALRILGPGAVTSGNPVVFSGATGLAVAQVTFTAFKTSLALVKADVGLGNVDNTSDVNKPVSTAQAAADALKASLTGATFTGPVNVSRVSGNTLINLTTADAGAVGAYAYLVHDSPSPFAADIAAAINVQANDSLGVLDTIAIIQCIYDTVTSGAEDASWAFRTMRAGVRATKMILSNGLYIGTPTGLDKGYGTLNAVLYDNGVAVSTKLSIIAIKKFTVSGNYTPTAGTKFFLVEGVGGGGGSGGCIATTAGTVNGSGGGGGGAYSRKLFDTSVVTGVTAFVIGAAGTAATAGNNVGGNGGSTTFGTTLLTAPGGTGGGGAAAGARGAGGVGGVVGTGDVSFEGGDGWGGSSATIITVTFLAGGKGGGSLFQEGPRGANIGGTGLTGQNYGTGGGGSSDSNAAGAKAGAAGTAGYLIITEFG